MPEAFLPRRLFILALFIGLIAACGNDEDPPAAEDPPVADPHGGPPGDAIPGEFSRELTPDVTVPTFQDFSAHNRDFAFELFAHIGADEGDDENVFISPHSVTSALAMAYAGARNETRDEMAEVLRYQIDDDALFPSFNKLDLALQSRADVSGDGGPPTLAIANQAWGHKELEFVQDYLNILSQHFGSDMRAVDFFNDYEELREAINEWVENSTEERIIDLLPPGSLNADTRFVLVNAIYFYAGWKAPFDERHTEQQPFHLLDGTTDDVLLMRKTETISYATDDDTVMVSVPYVGDDLSFVAWMPADAETDFHQWQQGVDRQSFDELIDGLVPRRVRLFLPRFQQEQNFALSEIFQQMGMTRPFGPAADFGGIAQLPEDANLFIYEIFHNTFIKLDEEGTEAAAATAVVGSGDGGAPPEPIEVRLDRPFYYAIYDHPTDSILFLGRMTNP